jgi:carboxyl-terminal processing protease
MSCQTAFVARGHRVRWLFVLALLAALCPIAVGEPTAPGPSDRQITQAVTLLLKREHLTRHPVDNEISKRCLKEYLKALDRMKVYFYQSDVDKFVEHESDLSEWINKKDYASFLNFGYMVFRTFLERVDERVKMVDELLASQHDFTKDEEMTTDRDLIQYPRDAAEAYDRWRKRVKYDLLVMKATKKEDKKDGKKDGKKEIKKEDDTAPDAAQPKSEKDEAKEAIDRL